MATGIAPNASPRTVVYRPTKVLPSLSVSEQLYILEGCRDDCRIDGRDNTKLRSFSVLTGDPLILSHGSSRVFLTDKSTQILCSVKAELVKPSLHRPNEGGVDLHVDWLLGTPNNAPSKRRLQEQQLRSLLQSLLQDNLVPLTSLCVVPHHYVWKLAIDVMVVCADGGSVVDLSSRAVYAALQQTKLAHITPLVNTNAKSTNNQTGTSTSSKAQTDLAVDSDIQKGIAVDTKDCPVVVSVSVLKCPPKATAVFVLDTTNEEEVCASSIVYCAVTRQGTVVAVRNQGGSVPVGLLPDITAAAKQAANDVFGTIDRCTVQTPMESILQEQFRRF